MTTRLLPIDAPTLPPPAQPSDTRDAILCAAAELFGRQGYAATTLRRIASAAGVQAGSIYYHFHGKDEIAARVLDAGIEAVERSVRSRLAALAPDADGRTRLAAAVEGHLYGMLQYGHFTEAHIRIYRHVSAAARARHAPVRAAYTRLWDEVLEAAATQGCLRRDVPVPFIRQFLVGALNWPVDWFDPKHGTLEQFAHRITALALDGLAAPRAAA